MYGDVNPHNFDGAQRYFAFQATTSQYGPFAFEYNLNAMQPVCIEACVDYSTKEKDLLNVNAIFTALNTGEWNQVIARSAGMEVDNNPWLPLFWEQLNDELIFKYDHQSTLKLD